MLNCMAYLFHQVDRLGQVDLGDQANLDDPEEESKALLERNVLSY